MQNSNKTLSPDETSVSDSESVTVTVVSEGPYLVKGKVKIQEAFLAPDEDGVITKYRLGADKTPAQKTCTLCRCGNSKNKPFCDGRHTSIHQGRCVAPHTPLLQNAEAFEGPDLTLYDNEKYCAFARFCDGFGRIWNLVRQGSDLTNAMTKREAFLCPAGRFILKERQTGNTVAFQEEPLIQVIEDPVIGVHGPLGLRGKITVIDENNQAYERRNQQALCRCGKSRNKPFCDGMHAAKNSALKQED